MSNKNSKNKKNKIRAHTVNLKINTRIVITSVLAIVIPTIIICTFAGVFIKTIVKNLDLTTVVQTPYSILNQAQWGQAVNNLSSTLVKDDNKDLKLKKIKDCASPLEELGSVIYIEENGKEFYSTTTKEDVLDIENSFVDIKNNKDLYYFSENGAVIVSNAKKGNTNYKIIIVNAKYTFPTNTSNEENNVTGTITNRTIVIIAIVGLTFILAIIIISLITSKTIVGPVQKITRGANEIANGNLDYEIDYKSTNELGQLADSFNEMRLRVKASYEEKQKANQEQKEMIAGIAHDLRTPLTSIKGYVEGLRDGIADTKEKQARYINTIYNSTCDTEKMLNDLLTISKLELGDVTLNKEKVKIDDFINYAYEIGYDLESSDFAYEIINNTKTNPTISVDTDKFSRVIDNILSNSIKYKKPDVKGKITLTISEYEHSVIFEIADNGMGVDKESLPRIFDTLYRADKARSNVSDGSGLGLSVCKQIVELHGGMIWARSEPGNGLAIFISLPLEEEKIKRDGDEI